MDHRQWVGDPGGLLARRTRGRPGAETAASDPSGAPKDPREPQRRPMWTPGRRTARPGPAHQFLFDLEAAEAVERGVPVVDLAGRPNFRTAPPASRDDLLAAPEGPLCIRRGYIRSRTSSPHSIR
ncbi:hypothetical protein ACFPM0_09965 [Pseudonocardia sulfidoxydans]|uniref:hypothetical protein n=1 Tax=Pseudonocardia sulfidoxydans TaxID=54011 RepID=UPI00361BB979